MKTGFATLLALLPVALAQSAEWGQCGGIGWTGPTTCVSGTTCTVINSYYSQCLPGAASQAPPPPPSSSSSNPTSTASGPAPSGTGFNALAKAKGKKYFGSATLVGEFSDAAYVAILSDNTMFGQITPGNEMKWDATEPEQGVFSFTQGDEVVAFATKNGQIMRGHNLVWYSQLPSWVSNGQFTTSQLTSIIQNHVNTLVTHYKGQIYAWDVLNEPLADDGSIRADVFSNTLGQSFMNIALTQARTSDPNAKLYINDYNIEGQSTKSNSMASLVKNLKSQGVPVDGIGLESHFILNELPSGIQQQMETYTALGVEVAITELDIRMTLPSSTTSLQQQQSNYQSIVADCMAVEGCVGITVWDFTDKYSWVPQTFPGQGAACPWDQNLQRKPAFNGIIAALS